MPIPDTMPEIQLVAVVLLQIAFVLVVVSLLGYITAAFPLSREPELVDDIAGLI